MNSDRAPAFEPLLIDPRKVERYQRYLLAYARLHAQDPIEFRRRYLAGLRFLARLRARSVVQGDRVVMLSSHRSSFKR